MHQLQVSSSFRRICSPFYRSLLSLPCYHQTCPPSPLPFILYTDNSLPVPVAMTSLTSAVLLKAYNTANDRYLLVRQLESQKSFSNFVALIPFTNSHSATRLKSFFIGQRKPCLDMDIVFTMSSLTTLMRSREAPQTMLGHCRPHPPR